MLDRADSDYSRRGGRLKLLLELQVWWKVPCQVKKPLRESGNFAQPREDTLRSNGRKPTGFSLQSHDVAQNPKRKLVSCRSPQIRT
jgi:hypothetical protein